MNANVKIVGLEKMQQKIKQFNLAVGKEKERLIPEAAMRLLVDMKANAPVDTGRLRNALESRVFKQNENYTGAVVGLTREAVRANPEFKSSKKYGTKSGRKGKSFYPASQEYGWTARGIHHLGKPYIRPSFDKNRRAIIDKAASDMRQIVSQV